MFDWEPFNVPDQAVLGIIVVNERVSIDDRISNLLLDSLLCPFLCVCICQVVTPELCATMQYLIT